MIASGPASPINPRAPRIGNMVGEETTPPLAKGITRPWAKLPPFSKGKSPLTRPFIPPAIAPPTACCTGRIAML